MKQFKTIAIIILVLLFTSYSKAWLAFNGGCKAFPNQCDDGNGTSTQALNLGQLIPIAGGYFLQSNSDFQIVLKKIELTEIGVIDSIGQAIQSMSAANANYFEIWQNSLTLDYDHISIQKLSQFDYTGYQIENNLNPTIFKRVEGFLIQGHVRELFQQAFEDSNKILEKLKEIQTTLESGKTVDISKYWRLNQLYLDFALFGQYASEVLNTT